MNALSVIIPSKNFVNLQACVGALHKHGEGRLIVIDDGLAESGYHADSTEYDEGGCLDGATIIPGIKPFVFAQNVNLGINAAGRDDIVILGDDGLLESPGGLTALQRQCALHPECGLMSAATNAGAAVQHRTGRSEVRYADVMVAFVCVFIPRTTLDMVGLLDEQFGVNAGGPGARGYGCEDDDFSWRVRAAGLKLGIYEGCFVDHVSLRSTFRGDPTHPADVRSHEALFQEKWGRHPHR